MKDDVRELRDAGDPFSIGSDHRHLGARAAELLFGLLLDVARKHQPEIEPLLKGGASVADFTPELMARALQAQGIWFQLLSIAEQNAAMRRRRQVERERGREELRGTFSHVLAEAARAGVEPEEIQKLISNFAHPPGADRPSHRVRSASPSWRSTARPISSCASLRIRAGPSGSAPRWSMICATRSSSYG